MPHDNLSELFYHVDDQDNELGSITRHQAHQDSTLIHRSVQIVLINSQSDVLLQQRSQHKDKYPGIWTVSASGHVTYGQTYEQAAFRELEEELGITCPLTYHSKSLVIAPSEKEFTAIFVGDWEATPTTFDRTEVDQVKWCRKKEIAELSDQQLLTHTAVNTLQTVAYLLNQ